MRKRNLIVSWLMLLAMVAQAFAGKVYWQPNAAAVPQETTFTVSQTGGWAAGDTATITVNGKTVTITLGSVSTSTTDVAAALAAALNSNDTSTTKIDLISDETKNIGGRRISEFLDFTAEAVASVVTITGTTDGRPFTAASSETAEGGAIADATPTAATGPNHYNNTENWDTLAIPTTADDVYFIEGGVDCIHGFGSAADLQSLTVGPGYSGNIGLALMNTDHGKQYREYRTRFLPIEFDTAADVYRLAGRGRVNLDTKAVSGLVYVESGNVSLITGVGVITLNALGGTIELGNNGADACVLGTMNVGNEEGRRATLNISSSCTFSTPVLTIYEGNVTLDAAIAATTTLYKGSLTVLSGAQTTIDVRGGALVYNGTGTLTTLNVYSGGADFSQDLRSKTITNVNMWKGTYFWDPRGVTTRTNAIDIEDGGLHEVDIKSVKARTWTESAL